MTLSARNLVWKTAGKTIVDDVSLDVEQGKIVGVLGPNGSGKSSLLRLITGLTSPNSGSVEIDGQPLSSLSRKVLARRLAFVEQEVSTDENPSAREVIELGRIPHRGRWAGLSSTDIEVVERAARYTNLEDKLDQSFATMSGGERQRLQIARALAQEPSTLVLDEPTNHLDIHHQLEVLRLVRSTGAAVCTALHDLNLAAAYCDEVLVLAGGRMVASGAPSEVLTEDLIESVYRVRARVVHDSDGLFIRFLST